MNEPTLVILAAGIGSRYGGLKQMEPVGPGDQTLIDYSVYDAGLAGFRRIVVVVKPEILDDFQSRLSSRWPKRFQVSHAIQELGQLPPGTSPFPSRKKPWGTAHALLAAAPHLQGPFASINADDFYGREAFQQLHSFLREVPPESLDFAMVGFRLSETLSGHGTVARGLCQTGQGGFLRSVREITTIEPHDGGARYLDEEGRHHRLSGRELVSLNCWGFTTGLLPCLSAQFSEFLNRIRDSGDEAGAEFYLPEAVNHLLASKQARVKVLESSQRWLGVTHRADLESVRRGISQRIERKEYPEKLWDHSP